MSAVLGDELEASALGRCGVSERRIKPETELMGKVRRKLEDLTCWVERLQSGTLRAKRGWFHGCSKGTPDLMVLWPVQCFLEIKLPGEKLNKDQVDWHRRARTAGIEVYVVESVDQACALAIEWFKHRYDHTWDALGLGG